MTLPALLPPSVDYRARSGKKRFTRRWVSATVLAFASGATVGVPPTADAAVASAPGAVLRVNDSSATGIMGDGELSLDEALRVASGSLDTNLLSAREKARITGRPGSASNDSIVLPERRIITVAPGFQLSATGNSGDTIDGQRAVIEASGAGPVGLEVRSSRFTVRDLEIRGFVTNLRVETGGRALHDVQLERLYLHKGTVSQLQVGAASSNGSLDGLSITDSTFEGAKDGDEINVLLFAAQTSAPASIDRVRLSNVLFARNTVRGGGQGLTLGGAFTFLSGVRNAVTSHVRVLDNRFEGVKDAPLNVDGAIAAFGSRTSTSGVRNVTVARNFVDATNYGMWTGNEAIGLNATPSRATNNFVDNVTFRDNTVRGIGHGRRWCFTAENAADFRGDYASGNVVRRVRVINNRFINCISSKEDETGYGAAIIAGRVSVFVDVLGVEAPGPGTAVRNHVRDVTIRSNLFKGSARPVVVAGGFARFASTATGNTLAHVRVVRNRFLRAQTPLTVFGGTGPADSAIRGNRATAVDLRFNKITGPRVKCRVFSNRGPGASGNIARGRCQR